MPDHASDLALLSPLTVSPEGKPDRTTIAECEDWLSFHRLWGQLGDTEINAIASHLQPVTLPQNTLIYQAGQTPTGCYFLKWGTVEAYRESAVGKTLIQYHNAGDIFGYLPLMTPQTPNYQTSAIALSPSELWFLSQQDFQHLRHTYPQIPTLLDQALIESLLQLEQRMTKEQSRIQGLQPYLTPLPDPQDFIHQSKAAQKLQKQITEAATVTPLKPVILQAPPGSGKTFVAGLIHCQSALNPYPFAELDCSQLPTDTAGVCLCDRLWDLIELLERGTFLLDNIQKLSQRDRQTLQTYLNTGKLPNNRQSWARLILASPEKFTLPNVQTQTLKLFSLSQRREDISPLATLFLKQFCQDRNHSPLTLDQADRRRLVSYDYPGNIAELAGILKRAVDMTPPEQTTIPEQVLWSVESQKNAFRLDLLNQFPRLRRFLLSAWWPERFWVGVMALFIPVTLLGFIGPQDHNHSMTLNFFWAWWWPFYLLLFPVAGRLWCSICPFMITGEWLRKFSLWLFPRPLRPWNNRWLNKWGAWWLFAGFVAIYLWEKLWDLPDHAYLSASLLLIITAGAVFFSLFYERRLWCRYLCPIGGMNGMFAKLSTIELRSTQQICGSQCSTFGCYKGSEATPVNFSDPLPSEGQATGGCPLYSHPAQLKDNRDCVLCMTCLKACPNRSVQLNLRFPATDLLEDHQEFWAEAALLLLLFGGVFMHYSHRILTGLGWGNLEVDSEHLLISLPIVTGLLSIPFMVTYLGHQISRWIDPKMPNYLRVVYSYLPLTLAANLAYYVPNMLTEAGQILPVIARTFGFSGEGLPTLIWSLDVVHFLQGIVLLTAIAFSLYPLFRITQRSWVSNLPHLLIMIGFVGVFFKLMMII